MKHPFEINKNSMCATERYDENVYKIESDYIYRHNNPYTQYNSISLCARVDKNFFPFILIH